MSADNSDAILARMMALHPKVIDLTLDRVWHLLDALGNPQKDLPPVIHIAGTNGKGSTLAMIRAGLEGSGKTCHAYTSPHLARFHERIRVAGHLISEADLTDVLDECYAANDGAPITYFEITTVAAILAFARAPADYTLLEVGLGGRLDATNVVAAPVATVITPVSMDHESFLGDTLPKIASEKAGIIKRGVPCIVGPQAEDGLNVIEDRAMALGAPLSIFGQHWHVFEERGRLIFQDENGLVDVPLPNLRGDHQVQNAGIALAVLRMLGQNDQAFEAAVSSAEWPARMQRLRSGPLAKMVPNGEVWLDGGHNPAAGQALAGVLKTLPPRPTHLIVGMLNTKDIAGYLSPLAEIADSLTGVSIPGEANTISAKDTAARASQLGMRTRTSENVMEAMHNIVQEAPQARILICGSLYLAGAVLRENT